MWQSLHQGQPKQYSIPKRNDVKFDPPQDVPKHVVSPSVVEKHQKHQSSESHISIHHDSTTNSNNMVQTTKNKKNGESVVDNYYSRNSDIAVNAEKLVSEKRYEDALDFIKNNNGDNGDLSDWIYRAMFADWGTRLRRRYMDGMDDQLEEGMIPLLLLSPPDDDLSSKDTFSVETVDNSLKTGTNSDGVKDNKGINQSLSIEQEEAENEMFSPLIIQPLNLPPPPPPPPQLPSHSKQIEKTLDYVARETMPFSSFMEMVRNGPASKLSVSQKKTCWKLYEELCNYYETSPKSIIFYAKFLAFPNYNYEKKMTKDFLPFLSETLGKKAAHLGDIYALKIILPYFEVETDDSNVRTEVLRTQLETLSTLSLNIDPTQYLHLLPTELRPDQLLLMENWFLHRIESCIRDTSLSLSAPISLSQFGAEQYGFTKMQQLQRKWRNSLALDLPGMLENQSENNEIVNNPKIGTCNNNGNPPQCTNDILKNHSHQLEMSIEIGEPEKKFQQTVEALENALRYQLEERMKIQIQLKQLQDEKQSNASNAHKMARNIKLLIQDIMGKHNSPDDEMEKHNSETVQNELNDLDELLSGFLTESTQHFDTTMDRKDVAWFINEIKWRLNRVQKVSGKEQSIVSEFMERLVKLLEAHLKKSDVITSTALTVANSTSSLPELETKLKREVMYEKEIEISKLHGRIIQLEEKIQTLEITANNSGESNKNVVKSNSSDLERKHHALENRHRTLVSQMQESLCKKNEELSSLRKLNLALEQKSTDVQATYSNKLSFMEGERDKAISRLELQIKSQNENIKTLRNDLQKSEHLREQVDILSQNKEADSVRLRYLENMIKELENALTQAKGGGQCKYDSISCFDMGNAVDNSEDTSQSHTYQNGNGNEDPSLRRILELESELADMARLLELSERKRARMQENFDRERSLYANRFQQIQDMMVKLRQEQDSKIP